MNIMRETLMLEERKDLLELLDRLDIRVINAYLSMGVPYADEVRELLMLQFNEAVCVEINKASAKHPEIMECGKTMINSLSREDKVFNHELMENLSSLIKRLSIEDLDAALSVEKCIVYYTSFFLDNLE